MHLFCHEHPETLTVQTDVADARPGKVALAQSPFYPGGGGQLADRGVIRWQGGEAKVVGFEYSAGKLWHLLDSQSEVTGAVEAAVDPDFRRMMRQLHTDTHVLNALVFQAFDGALVTGVQMADDGTARMDFDVPGADSDRLRALEGPINDLIRQDIPVNFVYVPMHEAQAEHGLIRSRSVAPPPTPDGKIRIVEIVGLDRQACGGTHLASTGQSPPIRILKVDNKGRHNRRVRIGLARPEGGPNPKNLDFSTPYVALWCQELRICCCGHVRFWLPIIFATVFGYFGYHLVNGDRGLLAMVHLQREVLVAEQNLAEAETTRKIWERRVAALRNQSLDPDMLDERARVLLNFSRKDDIVIFTPTR